MVSIRLMRFLLAGNLLMLTLLAGCKLPPGLMEVAPGLLTPTTAVDLLLQILETPVPATPTLPATIRLAMAPADISGTWTYGGRYLRFEADGTMIQADTLDRLDSAPFARSRYTFSGATMTIFEESAAGVPSCGSKAGRYEVRMQGSLAIRIVALDDPCSSRVLDLEGHYGWVLPPTPAPTLPAETTVPTPGGTP